jgi:tetratricopeptide (TPR) repeat protein
VALAIVAGITSQNVIIDPQAPLLLRRSFRLAIKSIVATVCLVVLWLATLQIKTIGTAYTNWKNAFDLYNIGIYTECLADYEKAYPLLKTNGDFLTNYGKALSMAEKHAEATKVLQQAARYYPNTVVYTALGDSYKKMGSIEQAEQAYLHAWHMNPSRFYPKYLLAKLYDETGQKEKAIQVANELLAKDIKIESTAIEEIKEEMKKLINK